MNRLRIIPLDGTVVFPGMPVTLPVDVGTDDRVLLVPRRDKTYSRVGIVAEVTERMKLAGRGLAVSLTGVHRATLGSASACLRNTGSMNFWLQRCGSSAALHDPESVVTIFFASRAEGSANRASSCFAKRVKYAMSVGWSGGKPSARISCAKPSRR